MPLGALLAVARFPGRGVLTVLLNALMGLPPVVVGHVVYLMLSRAGPLGVLGLLYTPAAMIIAQTVLVVPIVASLSRQVVEDLYGEYHELLRSMGASLTGLNL
jgi:tungstate transport system permease protein